jgi:TonB family protein
MMRAGRSTAIWLWLALAAGIGPARAAEPPAPSGLVDFDIPAEPLAQAIEQFAAATGVQVLYDRPVGAHLTSPGVHGRMTNAQALQQLIAGAGLTARFSTPGDVVLEPVGSAAAAGASTTAPPANLPSLALPPLRVTAPFELEMTDDDGAAVRLYASLVRNNVHQALMQTPKLSREEFDASLDLWVSANGVVRSVRLQASSGHAERDALIQAAIEGLALDAPPPPGLPQPIHVSISARHR